MHISGRLPIDIILKIIFLYVFAATEKYYQSYN